MKTCHFKNFTLEIDHKLNIHTCIAHMNLPQCESAKVCIYIYIQPTPGGRRQHLVNSYTKNHYNPHYCVLTHEMLMIHHTCLCGSSANARQDSLHLVYVLS